MIDPNKQGPFNWADLFTQATSTHDDATGHGQGHVSGPDTGKMKERLADLGKRAIVILAILVILGGAFAYWWFHPAINIHSTDLWGFIVAIMIALIVLFMSFKQIYQTGMGKREKSPKKANIFSKLMIIPIAVLLVGFLGWATSLSLFPGNAEKFANILQTEDANFAEDISEADYSTIPFIDKASAELLGNRAMGTMADYVSQFEISDLYSQINYQDKPVRVSPLNYADLFKWWANQENGIPAYVIVNMTTQDTQVVRLENPIHYSDSDPLFKNVDRHVQLSYPFYMFDEKSFEIDDDGTPWWIFPVQDRTIGLFGGTTIQRVVLCNASTGETIDYAIDEVPQWVDRAYPAELLITQYNWSGSLWDGWINSWLGQNGVKQTTPGTNGKAGYNYIAQDDDVWVYSGVTSATADNSIIGFVLINQRTGQSHFYSVAGATEDSAMRSAEGQVQHLKYSATFPLLINVEGQPTYFMALKDDAGLVKMYAMVDIQRYQNVAVGDSLSSCQKTYKQLLRQNGISSSGASAEVTDGSVTGEIVSITPVVVDGNSHFYITISGSDAIYDCQVSTLVDVVRYSPGDKVTLTVSGSGTLIAINDIQKAV